VPSDFVRLFSVFYNYSLKRPSAVRKSDKKTTFGIVRTFIAADEIRFTKIGTITIRTRPNVTCGQKNTAVWKREINAGTRPS